MSGHGHVDGHGSKRVALLISVLALALALVETGAKGSQTEALTANVESSNLWAFFQARSIRQTIVRTAAEQAELTAKAGSTPAQAALLEAQRDKWEATARRWEDEPATGEGRKQLAERAKKAEEVRTFELEKYHLYEYAAAALQVAIVVVSASIVTGTPILVMIGSAIAAVGAILGAVGFLAPQLIPF